MDDKDFKTSTNVGEETHKELSNGRGEDEDE